MLSVRRSEWWGVVLGGLLAVGNFSSGFAQSSADPEPRSGEIAAGADVEPTDSAEPRLPTNYTEALAAYDRDSARAVSSGNRFQRVAAWASDGSNPMIDAVTGLADALPMGGARAGGGIDRSSSILFEAAGDHVVVIPSDRRLDLDSFGIRMQVKLDRGQAGEKSLARWRSAVPQTLTLGEEALWYGWELRTGASGQLLARFHSEEGYTDLAPTVGEVVNLGDGEWHLIALHVEAQQQLADGRLMHRAQLFVHGREVASGYLPVCWNPRCERLLLGTPRTDLEGWSGRLEEVVIWNRALHPEEANLVAEWDFESIQGRVAGEPIGDHHGQLRGGALMRSNFQGGGSLVLPAGEPGIMVINPSSTEASRKRLDLGYGIDFETQITIAGTPAGDLKIARWETQGGLQWSLLMDWSGKCSVRCRLPNGEVLITEAGALLGAGAHLIRVRCDLRSGVLVLTLSIDGVSTDPVFPESDFPLPLANTEFMRLVLGDDSPSPTRPQVEHRRIRVFALGAAPSSSY